MQKKVQFVKAVPFGDPVKSVEIVQVEILPETIRIVMEDNKKRAHNCYIHGDEAKAFIKQLNDEFKFEERLFKLACKDMPELDTAKVEDKPISPLPV